MGGVENLSLTLPRGVARKKKGGQIAQGIRLCKASPRKIRCIGRKNKKGRWNQDREIEKAALE